MSKKILVTGSHRSGTTWTGKIISKGKKVRYIHEPFNIGYHGKKSPLTYWFEYITDETLTEHKKNIIQYINSFNKVLELNDIKRLARIRSLGALSDYITDIISRLYTERTVLKDPIAIMSAEWLYDNFDMDVVVLIRHPAAFVASLKIKDWQYNFNNYLSQDSLMNNYLKDYKDLIVEYSQNKKDIIDQGILLWNTIHDVIAYYKSKYGAEWHFVKHEDLSLNPNEEFKKLFSKIGLPFNSAVENYLNETTKAKVDLEVMKNSTQILNVKRNSVENIKSWKKRLSLDEIQRIKIGTEKVWKKFYTENDW